MSKPSRLSSFYHPKEGLLWANKCCSHVPVVLIGLVLQVGDGEHFLETPVLKDLHPAFCVSVKRPGLAAVD
ncbi:hypothetical protein DPMN_165619 [Dreissena polymorpha]|uniref:Uncharacterized protein n=1 Tax=Dreissena polymorpha TaxID=45954 RepID=A0A9D4EVN5_DREPO|nr:hypothetical protein DPMN_165619 [Dreissena polymorpha]